MQVLVRIFAFGITLAVLCLGAAAGTVIAWTLGIAGVASLILAYIVGLLTVIGLFAGATWVRQRVLYRRC